MLTLVAVAPVLLPLRKVLGLFLAHLQGHLFMDWSQGPERSAVYRDLHSVCLIDSLQSALLPLVALGSPPTLRSRTGRDYPAHSTAELRETPGVTHGEAGSGRPPCGVPRSLLVLHMQNLVPRERPDPARAELEPAGQNPTVLSSPDHTSPHPPTGSQNSSGISGPTHSTCHRSMAPEQS